ncbi:MAG: hypothetical protein WA432_03660 [Candidatus Babeliaceae bacterium]
MNDLGIFLHFLSIATLIILTIIGIAVGQALISISALQAMDRQPQAAGSLQRGLIIALALNELGALASMVMIALLLLAPPFAFFSSLAQWAIVAAIGIPSCVIGLASALPVRQAFNAIARQPFFAQKIINLMALCQTIIQTPIFFGLIIGGWFIRNQLPEVTSLTQSLKLLAAGLVFGLGSIGPTIGLSIFASTACWAVGINKTVFKSVFTFTLMSQALIETPLLFTLILAPTISLLSVSAQDPVSVGITLFAAAFVMAFSTFHTSINSARSARSACREIAYNPELYPSLSRVSLLGQAFIDTNVIYGLIIAALLISWR